MKRPEEPFGAEEKRRTVSEFRVTPEGRHSSVNRLFYPEGHHESFIVCCPKCKTFESLHVRVTGDGMCRIEETSHYYVDKKSGDVMHKCGKVCTFTGKRFIAKQAKVIRASYEQ